MLQLDTVDRKVEEEEEGRRTRDDEGDGFLSVVVY